MRAVCDGKTPGGFNGTALQTRTTDSVDTRLLGNLCTNRHFKILQNAILGTNTCTRTRTHTRLRILSPSFAPTDTHTHTHTHTHTSKTRTTGNGLHQTLSTTTSVEALEALTDEPKQHLPAEELYCCD